MLYAIRNRTKWVSTEELVWSLCFAFLIPAVTGIVSLTNSNNKSAFYYSVFAIVSFGLWRLNKLFFLYLKAKISFEREYSDKRYWLLTLVFLFSSLITILFLFLWNVFVTPVYGDWKSFIDSFILLVGFSVIVTLLEENNLLNGRKQKDLLKIEKTEQLKAEAELQVLKNQIDPHFLFNSLNTMSFLIEKDQAKAKLFNDTLAEVYQYILLNRQKNLVPLKQELEFAKNYFRLLTIRYPEGMDMSIDIDKKEEKKLLPPISLQILLENAVKHNGFSIEQPLHIEIVAKDGHISVKNNLQKNNQPAPGTRHGLENLAARYELISNKLVSIYRSSNHFSVKLPLLNNSHHV